MLAEGEFVTAECSGIMVIKWRGERSVVHIHITWHCNADTSSKGYQSFETKNIRQYNLAIGGMDLKD
jgi:hypothetical protein